MWVGEPTVAMTGNVHEPVGLHLAVLDTDEGERWLAKLQGGALRRSSYLARDEDDMCRR